MWRTGLGCGRWGSEIAARGDGERACENERAEQGRRRKCAIDPARCVMGMEACVRQGGDAPAIAPAQVLEFMGKLDEIVPLVLLGGRDVKPAVYLALYGASQARFR
jgi:hypothetical protein